MLQRAAGLVQGCTLFARDLMPSPRGELEITDVNIEFMRPGRARLVRQTRGYTWMDCSTHDDLLAASR